jgi:hypothetical protein
VETRTSIKPKIKKFLIIILQIKIRGFQMESSSFLFFVIAGIFVAATCYPALSGAFAAFAVGGILGLIIGITITGWAVARSVYRVKRFVGESDLLSRFLMGFLAPQLGSATPPSVPSFLARAPAPPAPPAAPVPAPTFRQDVKVAAPRDEPTIICSAQNCGLVGDLDFVDNNGKVWHNQCFANDGCYVCHKYVCNDKQKCATEHGVAHFMCYQTKCRQIAEDIIGKVHSSKVNQVDLERAEKAMSTLSFDGTRSFLHSMKELVKKNCPNSQKPGLLLQECVCGYWLGVIDKQLEKRQCAMGTTSCC